MVFKKSYFDKEFYMSRTSVKLALFVEQMDKRSKSLKWTLLLIIVCLTMFFYTVFYNLLVGGIVNGPVFDSYGSTSSPEAPENSQKRMLELSNIEKSITDADQELEVRQSSNQNADKSSDKAFKRSRNQNQNQNQKLRTKE